MRYRITHGLEESAIIPFAIPSAIFWSASTVNKSWRGHHKEHQPAGAHALRNRFEQLSEADLFIDNTDSGTANTHRRCTSVSTSQKAAGQSV
jgi:hypothetical protein